MIWFCMVVANLQEIRDAVHALRSPPSICHGTPPSTVSVPRSRRRCCALVPAFARAFLPSPLPSSLQITVASAVDSITIRTTAVDATLGPPMVPGPGRLMHTVEATSPALRFSSIPVRRRRCAYAMHSRKARRVSRPARRQVGSASRCKAAPRSPPGVLVALVSRPRRFRRLPHAHQHRPPRPTNTASPATNTPTPQRNVTRSLLRCHRPPSLFKSFQGGRGFIIYDGSSGFDDVPQDGRVAGCTLAP
jgi:hypothetical protein